MQLAAGFLAALYSEGYIEKQQITIPAITQIVITHYQWILPAVALCLAGLLYRAKVKNQIGFLWAAKSISFLTIAVFIVGLILPYLFAVPALD